MTEKKKEPFTKEAMTVFKVFVLYYANQGV